MKELSDTFYFISLVFTSFSVFGLLITIFSIFYTGLHKNINYRIYLYTSFSIFLLSTSLVLPTITYPFLCGFQGFINNCSLLSCIIWSSLLFFNIYSQILFEKSQSEKYLLGLGFALPFLITFPEFLVGIFDEFNGWCSFDTEDISQFLLVGQLFIPYFVSIFFNITAFMRIKIFLKGYPIGFFTEEYLTKKKTFGDMRKLPLCINFALACPMIYEYYYLRDKESNLFVNIIGIIGETILGYCVTLCFVSNFLASKRPKVQTEIVSSSSAHSINDPILKSSDQSFK